MNLSLHLIGKYSTFESQSVSVKMAELILFIGFLLSNIALFFCVRIIHSYLRNKQPGSQTIYDIAICDLFVVHLVSGSVQCFVPMASLIDTISHYFHQDSTLCYPICIFYDFVIGCNISNLGCTIFIRMLCLTDMEFIEGQIGEKLVRKIVWLVTGSSGFIFALTGILSGDVVTGLPMSLLINKDIQLGNNGQKSLLDNITALIKFVSYIFRKCKRFCLWNNVSQLLCSYCGNKNHSQIKIKNTPIFHRPVAKSFG